MSDGQSSIRAAHLAGLGLCALCIHMKVVDAAQGNVYFMCGLHKSNPDFAKYPRLPVMTCSGFEAKAESSS